MKLSYLVATLAVLLALVAGVSALAAPMEATISLGRDPEPPMCTQNSGGVVTIDWNIEHSTTPNYVYYKLEDPTRTTILEQQTYSGGTGITVNRQWTVPAGAVDGKYWVRVEYWSLEAGNEANAEVTFYVCSETSSICAEKWEDTDGDNDCDANDATVENWWICLTTPFGDTFCKKTGADGRVCWNDLILGEYTLFEPDVEGWDPIGPSSYDLTLTSDPVERIFCNKPEPSATQKSSWGTVKSIYR
jgi:hypothetical protein